MLFSIAFACLLFFGYHIYQCMPQRVDLMYHEPEKQVETKKEPNLSWFHKNIQAEFKGVEYDRIVVYDAEDDMEFSLSQQDMTFSTYLQLRNYRKGEKVNIEVQSLVDLDTDEVVKRECNNIWL